MITITAEVRGDGMSIELTKEILDENKKVWRNKCCSVIISVIQ